MKNRQKITKGYEYGLVLKKGRSFATRSLVLYYLKNNSNEKRVGFIVSKKIGNAVKRNRVKRLLREGYRRLAAEICHGYDMVFIARFRAVTLHVNQAAAEMEILLQRGGLIKSAPQ